MTYPPQRARRRPLYSEEITSHLKTYCQPKEESNTANRVRQIRKEIRLTEQEDQIIKSKMAELETHNFGSYARKMLIDGYIINVDYTELRKLCAAVSNIGSNINQIAYRMKTTGNFYAEDIAELHAGMVQVNDALRGRLKEETKWEGKAVRIAKKNREMLNG